MRKSVRIKKSEEFQKVINHHRSVANKFFIVYQLPKPEQRHFRLGLSVSKKVGKAHERVWVKRRIRQAMLELTPQLPPVIDILVIARPSTNGQSQAFLTKQLQHALTLAKLLPRETEV